MAPTNHSFVVMGTVMLSARVRMGARLARFLPRAIRPIGVAWDFTWEPGRMVVRSWMVFDWTRSFGKDMVRFKENPMGWGNPANVITTNVDAGTDDPAQARAHIKSAMDELTNVINGRGTASGVASLDSTTKIPAAQLPLVTGLNGQFIDSTPGSGRTWTVPAGVTRVRVTCVGGGGGGGYTSVGTGGDHGGGGGAGGVISKIFTVVPGDDFSYTVGAKGVGGANSSDNDGADGGYSLVQSDTTSTPASFEIRANGGAGGLGPTTRFGGAGGQVSHTGDTVPGDPEASSTLRAPGGAGISGATKGGAGGSNSFQGGVAGGTGYGGGGGFGSGAGTSGFDGTDGFVMFEW